MKKTKPLNTDYFFEVLFRKTKQFLFTGLSSKLASLKVLAFITWFKDIN